MKAYTYDMKKLKKIIITLSLAICLCFSACAINVKTIIDKTSDLTSVFFFADTDFGKIEVYSGQREEYFEYNGISTPKVDYGIIKICFDKPNDKNIIDVSLQIDDEISNLILEQNPFDQSYMVDIEKQISANAVIKIKILDDNYVETIVECQSKNWKISDKDALEIAGKNMKDFLSENSKNGLDYECYLKVVHNIQDGERLYFYTFSVKTTQGKSANIVIDVNTGEVLVKSSP